MYITAKYNDWNDGKDYYTVLQTTQASTSELVVGDYDAWDAINNPTKGSDDIDIGNISTSAYNTWTLNATGMGWISKTGNTLLGIREGHDQEDSKPSDPPDATWVQSSITFSTSEETGTTQDPKLVVTHSGIITETLSEAITITDSIIKRPQKIFTETATIVDSITKSLVYTRVLPETVVIVDSILKFPKKILAETITVIDTLLRLSKRVFSEAITIVDNIVKIQGKIFSEAITIVDNILSRTSKVFSETITIIGSILKRATKIFSEAINIVDTVLKKTVTSRILTDSFSIIDTLWQRFKRAVASWTKSSATTVSHTKESPTHADWTMERGQAEN